MHKTFAECTYCLLTHNVSVYIHKAPPNTQTTLWFSTHMPHTLQHTHSPHSDSALTCCSKTALLHSKIIVVIRSSPKERVTDGEKLAGKKTAIHRYLKKRLTNTLNLRKANGFIWEVYEGKKKKTKQYLTESNSVASMHLPSAFHIVIP